MQLKIRPKKPYLISGVLEDESLHLIPGDETGVVGIHHLEVSDVEVLVSVDGGIGVSLGVEDSDNSAPVLGPGEEARVVGVGVLEEFVGLLEGNSLSVGVEVLTNESVFLMLDLLVSSGDDGAEKGNVLEHIKN